MSANKRSLRSRLPAIAGFGFMALFTAAAIWLVKDFIDSSEAPQKPRVQQISLVKPPPPRPEEKPPEPEEKIEEVKQEEVQMDAPPPDQPDAGPPPGEQLGLDADGAAGGDGFGLAARKGGRDITTLGGGSRESREAWYGRLISRHFEEGLRRSKKLQDDAYQVILQVWFDAGGAVRKVQLVRGSGNAATDALIKDELLALQPLREALPEDLPQPVRIRLASRA